MPIRERLGKAARGLTKFENSEILKAGKRAVEKVNTTWYEEMGLSFEEFLNKSSEERQELRAKYEKQSSEWWSKFRQRSFSIGLTFAQCVVSMNIPVPALANEKGRIPEINSENPVELAQDINQNGLTGKVIINGQEFNLDQTQGNTTTADAQKILDQQAQQAEADQKNPFDWALEQVGNFFASPAQAIEPSAEPEPSETTQGDSEPVIPPAPVVRLITAEVGPTSTAARPTLTAAPTFPVTQSNFASRVKPISPAPAQATIQYSPQPETDIEPEPESGATEPEPQVQEANPVSEETAVPTARELFSRPIGSERDPLTGSQTLTGNNLNTLNNPGGGGSRSTGQPTELNHIQPSTRASDLAGPGPVEVKPNTLTATAESLGVTPGMSAEQANEILEKNGIGSTTFRFVGDENAKLNLESLNIFNRLGLTPQTQTSSVTTEGGERRVDAHRNQPQAQLNTTEEKRQEPIDINDLVTPQERALNALASSGSRYPNTYQLGSWSQLPVGDINRDSTSIDIEYNNSANSFTGSSELRAGFSVYPHSDQFFGRANNTVAFSTRGFNLRIEPAGSRSVTEYQNYYDKDRFSGLALGAVVPLNNITQNIVGQLNDPTVITGSAEFFNSAGLTGNEQININFSGIDTSNAERLNLFNIPDLGNASNGFGRAPFLSSRTNPDNDIQIIPTSPIPNLPEGFVEALRGGRFTPEMVAALQSPLTYNTIPGIYNVRNGVNANISNDYLRFLFEDYEDRKDDNIRFHPWSFTRLDPRIRYTGTNFVSSQDSSTYRLSFVRSARDGFIRYPKPEDEQIARFGTREVNTGLGVIFDINRGQFDIPGSINLNLSNLSSVVFNFLGNDITNQVDMVRQEAKSGNLFEPTQTKVDERSVNQRMERTYATLNHISGINRVGGSLINGWTTGEQSSATRFATGSVDRGIFMFHRYLGDIKWNPFSTIERSNIRETRPFSVIGEGVRVDDTNLTVDSNTLFGTQIIISGQDKEGQNRMFLLDGTRGLPASQIAGDGVLTERSRIVSPAMFFSGNFGAATLGRQQQIDETYRGTHPVFATEYAWAGTSGDWNFGAAAGLQLDLAGNRLPFSGKENQSGIDQTLLNPYFNFTASSQSETLYTEPNPENPEQEALNGITRQGLNVDGRLNLNNNILNPNTFAAYYNRQYYNIPNQSGYSLAVGLQAQHYDNTIIAGPFLQGNLSLNNGSTNIGLNLSQNFGDYLRGKIEVDQRISDNIRGSLFFATYTDSSEGFSSTSRPIASFGGGMRIGKEEDGIYGYANIRRSFDGETAVTGGIRLRF